MPTFLALLILFFREYKYFHTIVEKWVLFWVIEDFKCHFGSLWWIAYAEIKPLCMSSRVNIILENQLIVTVANLGGESKVTWFKPWFKNQSSIVDILFAIDRFDFEWISIWFVQWHLLDLESGKTSINILCNLFKGFKVHHLSYNMINFSRIFLNLFEQFLRISYIYYRMSRTFGWL